MGIVRDSMGSIFPLFEEFSEHGRVLEISMFFQHIRSAAASIQPSFKKPLAGVIVSDFSLSMLFGICEGVNKYTLKAYLSDGFKVLLLNGEFSPEKSLQFICTAQVVHAFSRFLARSIPKKQQFREMRLIALKSLVRIQVAKTIKELADTVHVICQLFDQPNLPEEKIQEISDFIDNPTSDITEPEDDPLLMSMFDEAVFDVNYHNSIKESSGFYSIFRAIRMRKSNLEYSDATQNQFYKPEILDILQEYYIPYTLLWSAMMLYHSQRFNVSRVTNSYIEDEFNFLKNNFHQSKRKPINTFVRDNELYHKGRVDSYISSLAKKSLVSNAKQSFQKDNGKNHSENDHNIEEIWKRTPQRSKTKVCRPRVLFETERRNFSEGVSQNMLHA